MQKLYVRLAYVFENAFALTPYFLLQLACVQTSPLPQKKIGRRDDTSLLPIFFWGRGDVCTQASYNKQGRKRVPEHNRELLGEKFISSFWTPRKWFSFI